MLLSASVPAARKDWCFFIPDHGRNPADPFPFLSRRHLRLSPVPLRRLAMEAASSFPTPQVAASGDGSGGDADVFHRIKAHQEAAARLSPIQEVRTVMDHSVRGMLSTFSMDFEGYPSGSMVDFACDRDGSPLLAVSSLAVHAKNLSSNRRCSLLVAKDPEDRTDLIITLYGDAVPVAPDERESIRSTYLRKHPKAFWVDFGDFHFIRFKPKVVTYVSGVATALLGSGKFEAEEYKAAKVDPISQFAEPVTLHMNRDHEEDTRDIVRYSTSIRVNIYRLTLLICWILTALVST